MFWNNLTVILQLANDDPKEDLRFVREIQFCSFYGLSVISTMYSFVAEIEIAEKSLESNISVNKDSFEWEGREIKRYR
jgi:hypothetical protein